MSQLQPAAEPSLTAAVSRTAAKTDTFASRLLAWHLQHYAGLVLSALILLAAVIRFYSLSTPCLWYDEARVYYRVCGSYAQLLQCLRTDGFGPLHYELYWVMVQALAIPSAAVKWHWLWGVFPSLPNGYPQTLFPSPVMMRFIPALAGTLMVPAIYFLARQLLPVKTALLAAAFTACSAFLIFYSRDAKMYMETWLLGTLGMGSFLWWLRTNLSTAWLCWIAAMAAAGGIHATALVALPLSLLFLLSQKTLTWQKTLLWLAGIVLITAGPVGYYEKFNTFKDRVSADWHNSELQWVNIYNYGRTGPQLYRYLGSSMLIGWEWPRDNTVRLIQPARVTVPSLLVTLLGVLLVAGAVPWPRRWRATPSPEPLPQPRWRALLWVMLWLAVPTYGFYCRSAREFASPLDWFRWAVDLLPEELVMLLRDHQWPWAVLGIGAGAVILAAIRNEGSRLLLLRGLELLGVFSIVIAVLGGIYLAYVPAARAAIDAGKPWESVWVPRYIGMIWPAIPLAVAALTMRLPTQAVRWTAVTLLLGINLFFGGTRIFAQTEPPVQQMAIDAFTANNPQNHTLFWSGLRDGRMEPGGGNLCGECGEYYYQSLERLILSPERFVRDTENLRRNYIAGWFHSPLPADRDIPPATRRIVVWNQYNPDATQTDAERIPAGWTPVTDVSFTVRDFWTWQDLAAYRRREFVKTAAVQAKKDSNYAVASIAGSVIRSLAIRCFSNRWSFIVIDPQRP